MNRLVKYFSSKHLLVNLITALVLFAGIVAWNSTNKEELPDITFNTIRISTVYPGSSADDIEFFITKPIEDVVQVIDGVKKLSSTSSYGQSMITIELEQAVKDMNKVLTEVQNMVSTAILPIDLPDDPRIRMFETSKKAIIDIALYKEDEAILSVASRAELQAYVRGLENKLLALPEIFSISRNGYLREELTINVDPAAFVFYEIPLSTITREIKQNHVRTPAGTLKTGKFEQLSVLNELDTKPKLENVVIQGGFDSTPILLKSLATITDSFEEKMSIYKVNGKQAVVLNIVKNSNVGILDALEKVRDITTLYQQNNLTNTPFKAVFLDDESIDIKNRLSIVGQNGIIGFCLILLSLFIFLNKRSGFWVALGIPFTLSFTLICGYFFGYSINGITLAAIIIVLGIVVDDAIIVAENISRKLNEGVPLQKAAVDGTVEVIPPILASIITTCVAFLPLLFFSGRFGKFVIFIPVIIFLMLGASLLESFLLLPSHMTLFKHKKSTSFGKKVFDVLEGLYQKILEYILPKRYFIALFFVGCLMLTGFVALSNFKFVIFPNQESREIVLSGTVPTALSSIQTAESIQPIEDFLNQYVGNEGVGVRSTIARGRRGSTGVENQFRITLEILPYDQRDKSIDQLISEIKSFLNDQTLYENITFRKRRYGQVSGSAFEIIVLENNDQVRETIIQKIKETLSNHPAIINVEEDSIPSKEEYIIEYNQAQLKSLSVSPDTVGATLRTILNGTKLYTIFRNDEDVDVKLTLDESHKKTIHSVLDIPVNNSQNYLIPLKEVLSFKVIEAKSTIRRQNLKRASFIYADLAKDTAQSPTNIASEFELNIFPHILAKYPSAQIFFEGEVMDTRESKKEFLFSVLFSLLLIYIVLAVLFDSILKPFRIMLIIPFGVIGVIAAFYLHGKFNFGFYAAIGTLGMLGVVVNDAIVMLAKLDKQYDNQSDLITFTANIAKTRLRAITLTTLTTVVGIMPTAYGFGGTDAMLSDMMLSMGWGLVFGTAITLVLTPCVYLFEKDIKKCLGIKN